MNIRFFSSNCKCLCSCLELLIFQYGQVFSAKRPGLATQVNNPSIFARKISRTDEFLVGYCISEPYKDRKNRISQQLCSQAFSLFYRQKGDNLNFNQQFPSIMLPLQEALGKKDSMEDWVLLVKDRQLMVCFSTKPFAQAEDSADPYPAGAGAVRR